jgi:hypothetical protein
MVKERRCPLRLIEKLDVGPKRRQDERARHVDAAGHPVQRGEAQPQTFPELHWRKDQRASTSDTVRQQPPLERFIVLPNRVRRVDEKALIVVKDISRHGGYKGENSVFGTNPWLPHSHYFSHEAIPERDWYAKIRPTTSSRSRADRAVSSFVVLCDAVLELHPFGCLLSTSSATAACASQQSGGQPNRHSQ